MEHRLCGHIRIVIKAKMGDMIVPHLCFYFLSDIVSAYAVEYESIFI